MSGIAAGLRSIEREMERDRNLQRIAEAAEKIADSLDEIRAALIPKAPWIGNDGGIEQ